MTKYEHKTQAVQFDRLLFVVAFSIANLFAVSHGFAQNELPPLISTSFSPTISTPSPAATPTLPRKSSSPSLPPKPPIPPLNLPEANQAEQEKPATSSAFTPEASASTAAVSQRAFAPGMIGDGFAPAPFHVMFQEGSGSGKDGIYISVPGAGGTVGTTKIVENASPIPRDRVYFNYSDFNGVPLTLNGVNVHRFTPGFEKTFFNGMSSIEVRTPFASTLSNNLYAFDTNNGGSTQFGDLTIYLKQLFYRSETFAASVGLGFELPTASNTNVFYGPGNQLFSVKNQAVHLLPFLGSVYSPNEQIFVQQFLQFDFDANGNSVQTNSLYQPPMTVGRLTDMSYLYYSVGAGYWLYNNPGSDRFLTRIAPIVEMHYNKSLTSTDLVSAPPQFIGAQGINQDLLNGTIGVTAMFKQNSTLTLGYVTPLSSIDHRQFNSEFRLMFNWFFGGSVNRFSRVQF
ncbi:MAG: hypothetical protein WCH39_26610 [Schlesneria sp.]